MRKQPNQLVDDLDGSKAAQTIRFGLEEGQYEIDLSWRNVELLRSVLAPFISSARRAGGADPLPSIGWTHPAAAGVARKPARTDPEQLRHMRSWAFEHGHLSSRSCRLTSSAKQAYQDAHSLTR